MENISLSSVKRVVNQALCKKEKFKKREKKIYAPSVCEKPSPERSPALPHFVLAKLNMFLLSVQSGWLMFAEDSSACVFSLQKDVVEGSANSPIHLLLPSSLFLFLISSIKWMFAHSVSKGFHLVCVLIFEKENLLIKRIYTGEREECKWTVLLNKNE